ncbi:PREDICTED: ran-binding protein 10 isoform X3 [Theobroma cacao]|uniref:Ran-binding protein 10 isoform X3 n=1 Tax=Theobroma cacao TaxID=3641 RepID=A0AB32UX10_THECC|nr:PREDICTED: ran-binding protein 10 isoform X3 [Theobroma cacao]
MSSIKMNSCNSNNGESKNGTSNSLASVNHDLGLYFLELARLGSAKAPTEMEEDEEEAPKELNTINSSGGFLFVATDKLSVKYTSVNLHGHDVGVVQANKPAPVKRLLYYFEIYVKDAGAKGQIAIGFTQESFKMRRQPGWEANSFGYHGDDGFLYRGHGKGEAFGPTYTTGDTVGGGINYASQEFFFTKNGTIVGTVCVVKEIKGSLFPTVAVHSLNEEVHVNFGQKKFAFDLKEYEAQERLKQQMTIEKISLPPNISYGLVRSYLLHYGYEDTLNSFDLASKSTVPPIYIAKENGFDEQDIVYALNQRKTLRQLIRNGEIDAAISKLRDWYPQIVQDCGALLAYERPQESSVGYLLEESQRDVVADTVNAMILSTNPNMKDLQGCLHSYLEKLLRQLTACCLERRSANGDQGEAFHLHRVLNSGKDIKS